MKLEIKLTFTAEEYNKWCEEQPDLKLLENQIVGHMFRTTCNHSVDDAGNFVAETTLVKII